MALKSCPASPNKPGPEVDVVVEPKEDGFVKRIWKKIRHADAE